MKPAYIDPDDIPFGDAPGYDAAWLNQHASAVVAPVTTVALPVPSPNGSRTKPIADKKEEARLKWRELSSVEMRSIRFADKPLLQHDAFHLVTGRSGHGKGTVLAAIASRVTRGEFGPKSRVLWVGSEDSAAIDLRPRIEAAGGDSSKVRIIRDGWLQLPRDVDELRAEVKSLADVGMVVIDPVANHLAGRDSNSEIDIREAVMPLNQLADDFELMVFGVRHLTEKEAKQGVLSAILGSSAWVQLPRAVLMIVKDDEETNIGHIQCVKGNRLPPNTPGRMFRIEGVQLAGLESEVTRAVWIGDSTKDVESILSTPTNREASKSGKARELILNILENEGEQSSDALDKRVMEELGLAAQTLRNVRSKLNKEDGLIKNVPEKDEFGHVLHWKVARTGLAR